MPPGLSLCRHDVTVGFDKTYGQDVLYPQGGLHAASVEHNLHKYPGKLRRGLVRALKLFDLAHWSFSRLERRNTWAAITRWSSSIASWCASISRVLVAFPRKDLHVVRSAIDPERFHRA